jgi:hypothetical protein
MVLALKAETLQMVVLQVEALQALQAAIPQGVALQAVALQVSLQVALQVDLRVALQVDLQMVLQVMDLQEEIILQMRKNQKTQSQTQRTT